MIALFALASALAASGAPRGVIPRQFRGQWHAGNAPCGAATPGDLNVLDRGLILETEENGLVDEIEFGVRRVRNIGNRQTLAVGNWRENTIDNRHTSVRLLLSIDRSWLTVRLPGWQERYARCP